MKQPSISFLSVLLLLGSAQGLFLFFALLHLRKGNLYANRWLACLLFVFSISLIDGFMVATNYYLLVPHLIGFEWPINFAYGPFIYLYVHSLTKAKHLFARWKLLLHFIPALLLFVYLIPLYSLNSEQKIQWWILTQDYTRTYSIQNIDPIIIIVVIQIAVYLAISLRLLVRYSKKIDENFSAVESINLSWLRKLLIAFFILWLMYAFCNIFSGFYEIYPQAEYLLHLMIAIVIYVMGYKGLMQPEIFTALDLKQESLPSNLTEIMPVSCVGEEISGSQDRQRQKYKKSSLTDEQAEKILTLLIRLMEEKKPYLEMELTLPELSNMLSISPNHLSQVINERLNKSFLDFVNGYRVEEAKRLLISQVSNRLSILGIGMEAGFNSKSAFYSAFKKHTGITPSKFKKQYQK